MKISFVDDEIIIEEMSCKFDYKLILKKKEDEIINEEMVIQEIFNEEIVNEFNYEPVFHDFELTDPPEFRRKSRKKQLQLNSQLSPVEHDNQCKLCRKLFSSPANCKRHMEIACQLGRIEWKRLRNRHRGSNPF